MRTSEDLICFKRNKIQVKGLMLDIKKNGDNKVKKKWLTFFAFKLKCITFTRTSWVVSFAALCTTDDNMTAVAMEI